MGLCRNTIQEEISLAAFGPGVLPQPLAGHATKPAMWCQLPWWFCCYEVALSRIGYHVPSHPSSPSPTRGQRRWQTEKPLAGILGPPPLQLVPSERSVKCVALPHHPCGAGAPCVVHVCTSSPASGSKSCTVSMLRYS